MSEFSVGEVVIYIDNACCPSKYAGSECVIKHRYLGSCRCGVCLTDQGERMYFVVKFPDGVLASAEPRELRKKRPPEEYDGYQTTKWDTIPWVPKELVRA